MKVKAVSTIGVKPGENKKPGEVFDLSKSEAERLARLGHVAIVSGRKSELETSAGSESGNGGEGGGSGTDAGSGSEKDSGGGANSSDNGQASVA